MASKSKESWHVLNEMPWKELVWVPVFQMECSPALGKERRDQPPTALQSGPFFLLSQENAKCFALQTWLNLGHRHCPCLWADLEPAWEILILSSLTLPLALHSWWAVTACKTEVRTLTQESWGTQVSLHTTLSLHCDSVFVSLRVAELVFPVTESSPGW